MTHFGIILTGGPYQTERWETACGLAGAALDRNDSVTFFLFLDGVYNALSTQKFPAVEKVPKDYFKSLIERGATVYACEVCTNNRGLEEGRDFLPGVKLQGAMIVSDMVAKCDRMITLQVVHGLTVYLVDEPCLDTAMAYAKMDKDARIVLLQDAVYSALSGKVRGEAYVLENDVSRRGLGGGIPHSLKVIGYSDLVQMMEKERVVNFL